MRTTLDTFFTKEEKTVLESILERRSNETKSGLIAMKAFISRFTEEEAEVWKKYLEYYRRFNKEAMASTREEFKGGDS